MHAGGAFGALILAQAAHSIEEYAGRLWDVFPPARLVSGLFSSDLERGFLIANGLLLGFGLWCWIWPVRRHWRSAIALGWVWVGIELVNGIGHPLWSLSRGSYTPGAGTAPVLFGLAIYLGTQLGRAGDGPHPIR
jgi:hypothetical protein